MKNYKRLLFTSLAILILVAISAICLIFGRGHTIYFDNKTTEDESYHYYNAIDVYYNGEKVTTLNARERISVTCIGQKLEVELQYRKNKNDAKTTVTVTFDIPYSLDGIVINLPAYIEGADQSVYMSEFVPVISTEDEESEEDINTDEYDVKEDQ